MIEIIFLDPTLDSIQYRQIDQIEKVKHAIAIGRPVLKGSITPEFERVETQKDIEEMMLALPSSSSSTSSSLIASHPLPPPPPPPPPPHFAYNRSAHASAGTIQQCSRSRRTYKELSVIKIQSMFRAFHVYINIVRERRRHNMAAACIQCIHRGSEGRRKAKWVQLILSLQQLGRAWLARKKVNEVRTRRNGLLLYLGDVYVAAGKLLFVYKIAVRRIQRCWKWLLRWRSRCQSAATQKQKYIRRWLVLLRIKRNRCAIVLQRTIGRGALGRLRHARVLIAAHEHEYQRQQQEFIYAESARKKAKGNLVSFINGPCGIPLLSYPVREICSLYLYF